jgi:hypothetical protein
MVCAASGEGESERAASSSDGSGVAVLGEPGLGSGEEAMLLVQVTRARRSIHHHRGEEQRRKMAQKQGRGGSRGCGGWTVRLRVG